jgi:hypothetical protein
MQNKRPMLPIMISVILGNIPKLLRISKDDSKTLPIVYQISAITINLI